MRLTQLSEPVPSEAQTPQAWASRMAGEAPRHAGKIA